MNSDASSEEERLNSGYVNTSFCRISLRIPFKPFAYNDFAYNFFEFMMIWTLTDSGVQNSKVCMFQPINMAIRFQLIQNLIDTTFTWGKFILNIFVMSYLGHTSYCMCLSLFRNDASFTHDHVQRVPGSPRENGGVYELTFYVDYPGGGTMSLNILLLIMSVQLDFIATNSQLSISLLTTAAPPTMARNITEDNRVNALSILLTNFTATEVS